MHTWSDPLCLIKILNGRITWLIIKARLHFSWYKKSDLIKNQIHSIFLIDQPNNMRDFAASSNWDRLMSTHLNHPSPYQMIRMKQLILITGLSRSTIYNLMDSKSPHYDSTFPKSIQLTNTAVAWLLTEVNEWITSRIKASRTIEWFTIKSISQSQHPPNFHTNI